MDGSTERAANAIASVESVARSGRSDAQQRWRLATAEFDRLRTTDAQEQIARVGRFTVNFHPDRVARSGHTVAAGLAAAGRYRSQWVTGISNGGRSAVSGGDRARWEHELFGGAYDDADPNVVELPIYGAYDLLCDAHGGSPRFGSSYLVLRHAVFDRVTMCVGDSHADPSDLGTIAEPHALLAGLAEQAAARRLLDRSLDGSHLAAVLRGELTDPGPARSLDGYVEAQVHGRVDLTEDVEVIVVDPSFRGTDVDRDLDEVSRRYDVEVRWHGGSELHVRDVPDDFRGPTMPQLATRIARPDGVVDAHAIGVAAASIEPGPMLATGDRPDSPAQQLKYLWHTVLALGDDAEP